MDYREAIRTRMDELGWNNAGLAVASSVNPATLSRFFNGRQDLDVPQLSSVAHAMGLQPGDLLPRSDVDPMLERLAPLVEQLKPMAIEDQMRAVAALELALSAMKNFKAMGRENPSRITPSQGEVPALSGYLVEEPGSHEESPVRGVPVGEGPRGKARR